MFVCNRIDAMHAIQKLGEQQCCYAGGQWLARHCDCKYGGPKSGEKTGCPELRTLHLLLDTMEDHEFMDKLVSTGNATPPFI